MEVLIRESWNHYFISDKVYLQAQNRGYYIMTEGLVYQLGLTILCVCVPSIQFQMHETKTGRTTKRNREIHNYVWRSPHSYFSNLQNK